MDRLRTARAAAQLLRAEDPDSAITEYMIRKLMDSGEIPYMQLGRKKIVSIEAVEQYVNSKLRGSE